MDILKHPIYKAIYDLCREIEKFPASEQQTKCVVMASNLQQPADLLYSQWQNALSSSVQTTKSDSKRPADEPAHFIRDDGDGYEHMAANYWRQFLPCSDGRYVIGTGPTKETAEADASKKREEVEEFLRMPDIVQLKELVKPDKSYTEYAICSADMNSAIKILTRLFIEKHYGKH